MKSVLIDVDNLRELSDITEVGTIFEDGVILFTTKNGVVVRETRAKWGQVICEKDGAIWVEDAIESHINIKANLPEGIEKTLEATSEAELTEMVDAAMEKVIEKPKKATKPRKPRKKKES